MTDDLGFLNMLTADELSWVSAIRGVRSDALRGFQGYHPDALQFLLQCYTTSQVAQSLNGGTSRRVWRSRVLAREGLQGKALRLGFDCGVYGCALYVAILKGQRGLSASEARRIFIDSLRDARAVVVANLPKGHDAIPTPQSFGMISDKKKGAAHQRSRRLDSSLNQWGEAAFAVGARVLRVRGLDTPAPRVSLAGDSSSRLLRRNMGQLARDLAKAGGSSRIVIKAQETAPMVGEVALELEEFRRHRKSVSDSELRSLFSNVQGTFPGLEGATSLLVEAVRRSRRVEKTGG